MAQTYTPNTVVVFHCGGCTEQVDMTEGGVFINQLFQVANERETCSSSVAINYGIIWSCSSARGL